jgi:UDP-N-acetylmuramoyl-L-alanyl-D-glutamate--2,6-diaminopimelate ligase
MKLAELFRGVPCLKMGVGENVEVTSLAYDSRSVRPGSVFFAIQGEKADGHQFISAAIERGSVAIVSERPAAPELASRWVRVEKIRPALAAASRNFYGHPDSQLRIVGITGTNGKTTTAFLMDSIFRAAGTATGLFGTIEYRMGDRVLAAINTTPESLDLISYMAELVKAGGRAAVMEVSSHALAQERVWGFHFAAAVFTNLTRDHLDYHKDFESYFAAKRRLFAGLGAGPPDVAVINRDDPWGARLLDLPHARRITYGFDAGADVRVKQFAHNGAGLRATLATPGGKLEVESKQIGRANVYNVLAATATALGLGISEETIRAGIAGLELVPGRFERVSEGQPFLVIVDYAHTDDALRNVLSTARELTRNRLIVVFGCGGDRDRAKRPLMGQAAGSLSDLAVVTSDNPRSEDPISIMNDAIVGLQKTGNPYLAEADREVAIRKALEAAHEGDAVVLAGKGHETYQVLRDRTIPFDDREVARKILRGMGFGGEPGNDRQENSG